jgi:hypothetical protein
LARSRCDLLECIGRLLAVYLNGYVCYCHGSTTFLVSVYLLRRLALSISSRSRFAFTS